MGRAYLILGMSLALTACSERLEPEPRLAMACELKPCVCMPEVVGAFETPETQEVQWKESGTAYCNEGYVLRIDTEAEQKTVRSAPLIRNRYCCKKL